MDRFASYFQTCSRCISNPMWVSCCLFFMLHAPNEPAQPPQRKSQSPNEAKEEHITSETHAQRGSRLLSCHTLAFSCSRCFAGRPEKLNTCPTPQEAPNMPYAFPKLPMGEPPRVPKLFNKTQRGPGGPKSAPRAISERF